MIKIFIVALILSTSMVAKEYKAIIKPYNSWSILAQKSGEVTKLEIGDELKYHKKLILELDHKLEDRQLNNYKNKLKIIQQQLDINKKNYDAIKNMTRKSKFDKNAKELSYLSTKATIYDIKNTIATLEDTISKKMIFLNGEYLKKIHVNLGEYVNIGTKLLTLEDHRAIRVIIYVSANDIKNLRDKKIQIDGKIDNTYIIDKISRSPDETYISSYRVEFVKYGARDDLGKMLSIHIGE